MCIYADDITLFLNSLDSLQHVLNTFDLFSKYSLFLLINLKFHGLENGKIRQIIQII